MLKETSELQHSAEDSGPWRNEEFHLVIGVPAFNVEKTIAKVALQAFEHSDDVIVCDDGSQDTTAAIAKRIGCDVVQHEHNRGYGSALKTIIERARQKGADILVTVDGDAQHNLGDISTLIQPILDGKADMVIGSRFIGKRNYGNTPGTRKIGIKLITKLTTSITSQQVTDAQSGLRAYGKRAISSLNPGEQGMGASTEILLLAEDMGLRVLEVPTTINYRIGKTSTLNPMLHFADVVSSTIKVASIRHPLMTYGTPGIAFLLLSLVFGARTVQAFANQGQFDTAAALVSIAVAIIGTILSITALLLFVLVTVIREERRNDTTP